MYSKQESFLGLLDPGSSSIFGEIIIEAESWYLWIHVVAEHYFGVFRQAPQT